jgi:phage gpG-like protein
METALTVDVDDRAFEAHLHNIIIQLGSQGPGLMRAIGYYLRRQTVGHFEEEEDPEGRGWPDSQRIKYKHHAARTRRVLVNKGTKTLVQIKSGPRKGQMRTKWVGRTYREEQVEARLERIGKTLQDTGDLRRSIESLSDATSAEVGTNIYYGAFHQFGAPRAHIPVRAFLGIAEEDAGGIEALAHDYLVRALG